jgi:hypothetical protein
MLEALATALLLAMMGAFAVCAALFNEGSNARRRRRQPGTPPVVSVAVASEESAEVGGVATGDRRLPVGDFLFGALFLRGPEPLAFSALADAAEGSGMSVAQVLAWIDRAEAGGLIERVNDDEADEPAMRLTEAGIYIACNDRRRAKRAGTRDAPDAARAPSS